MRTLIIHNTLWAHYKSVLFDEINRIYPEAGEFHVLQIARSEKGRKGMDGGEKHYNYPYTLLFNEYLEDIPRWKEIYRVLKFILHYKPDVINVTGYSSSASTLPVIFLSKLLGKKVIMSNESTSKDKTRSLLKEGIKKMAIKACDGFVVFGKTSEQYVLDLGAKPDDILVQKAAVVDNRALETLYLQAKQTPSFPEITTPKNFIFVGRMAPEKNVHLLVTAFQKASPLDWGLILVGQGSQDEQVESLIAKAPKNIYKYKAVNWTEVPAFFARSNCFILPSASEPWGLVINEAMVCGLPVIVTDICGCAPDLVQDNGLVIPANDPSALEHAIKEMASTLSLEKMEAASRRIIQDFSVQNVAKAYVNAVYNL